MLLKGLVLRGFALYIYYAQLSDAQKAAMWDRIWGLFRAGVFQPYVGKVYPLEQLGDAMVESQRDARGGKVLVRS